jgi:copper homeostasis protein
MTAPPLIELCVEGVDGLVAAQQGGADRVELCASLLEGGLTPSLGTVRTALRVTTVPFHVMVRPRGGDFLYSAHEFDSMLDDTGIFRDAGAAGVVFGCLTEQGDVDADRTRALVQRAGPIASTFHRAFDMTRDPQAALEALIACGVGRVLTSGQRDRAEDGAKLLRRLHTQAAGRIVVLGCGGLRPETIAGVQAVAQLDELHFSAPMETSSAMRWRNIALGMGGTAIDREYLITLTDPALVARTIAAVRGRAT